MDTIRSSKNLTNPPADNATDSESPLGISAHLIIPPNVSDEHIPQITSSSIPVIKGASSLPQTVSLTQDGLNPATVAAIVRSRVFSYPLICLSLHVKMIPSENLNRSGYSEPTEERPIDMEMQTRPATRSVLNRLAIWRMSSPDRLRTESPVHPSKMNLKISWEVLLLPLHLIISIIQFLVILFCVIVSIVWVIPCVVLSVGWAAVVFLCAGRGHDDDDDDDDDFDTFLCWGVFPCCGVGFFVAIAIYGCKCIWGLGMVLVNPDNTSGINNWMMTSIKNMLDPF